MPTYRTSISIASPAAPIWHALSNVVAWPEWLPTVASVQALDDSALNVGNRYIVVQPKLRPATWTVTELEPARRFVWQARAPGLSMRADHVIAEQSATQSQVALEFSFSGLLGVPIGMLFRSITQSYLAQEAAALRLRAESGSQRSAARS